MGDATIASLEAEFPLLPGMTESDEIKMLDGFFATACAEDAATPRMWSMAAV